MKHFLKYTYTFLLAFTGCIESFNTSRIPSKPFISGDSFRSIAQHVLDETERNFSPKQVKKNDIIFVKTDYIPIFFKEKHPYISFPYILITHNGDVSPIYLAAHDHPKGKYDFSSFLEDQKLIAWFAQNIDFQHEKLKPIPIGIANNCYEHGRVETFHKAVQNVPSHSKRSKKIYLNFSVNNNKDERKPAKDYFSRQSFSYFAAFKPPAQYLDEMKNYSFVVNPPGNGIDCHRTWEALLLGCIPIIKHSLLDPMFNDLPIIFVNSWSEVTESFLEEKFYELSHKQLNLSKIYFDYWEKHIKKHRIS